MVDETIELYEDELELLERSKENILKSKNTAGLLFIPESLTAEYVESEDNFDPKEFEEELIKALATPLTSEEQERDGWHICQYIIRGPQEDVDKIRHIDLDSDPTGQRITEIDERIQKVKATLAVLKVQFDTDDEEVV